MNKKVAIIGGGGHATIIIAMLQAQKKSIYGIFDDAYNGENSNLMNIPMVAKPAKLKTLTEEIHEVYIAIGNCAIRKKFYEEMQTIGFKLPSLIHPKAIIADSAQIADASCICIGAVLSEEVKIGKGCIVNTASSIDHESVLSDFSHVAPQTAIAGRTRIGSETFIGLNASIANNLNIGNYATIGAGSVILKDVPDHTKAYGLWH